MTKRTNTNCFFLMAVLSYLFAVSACQSPISDISPDSFGRASLHVIWQPHSIQELPYYNPTPPSVRLYKTDEDWRSNINYIAHRDLITGPIVPISFDNLASENYWVKVFFVNTGGKVVEHNLNSDYVTPVKLQENVSYNMFVPTEAAALRQYHLNAIRIHDLPFAREYLGNQGTAIFRIRKIINYSMANTRIVYQQEIQLGDLPLTLSDINIDADIFDEIDPDGWSYYLIEILHPQGNENILEYYHFDIINLLSTNMRLDGNLSYSNTNGQLQYTLQGTFSLSN